jgi:flagellar hook-basal body complex protein FliE
MTIDPVAPLTTDSAPQPLTADVSVDTKTFADRIRGLAVGDPVDMHQVMVNLERAKMRFDLVLQIRNKLLDAYQEVMRMQV